MKKFNVNGTCFPDRHYMVDISDRLVKVKTLVDEGEYFCINRGRQYGKSTTLEALTDYLQSEYFVLQLSFEGVGEASFEGDSAMVRTFALKLRELLEEGIVDSKAMSELLPTLLEAAKDEIVAMAECASFIGKLVRSQEKPIVLIVDEVDQAGNHDSFLHFLGMLRDRYLKRNKVATFQSVILAGVYDIRNLKLKIRSEEEHQYNSPWNIAAPFDVDMSLSEAGIAGMLADYEHDHHTGMDIAAIAKLLREYTSGYPFLVSRLCQLMDGAQTWNPAGFLAAERELLHEANTLFDDLIKKLDQFPTMTALFKAILYNGETVLYNYSVKEIALATRFGIVKEGEGPLRISNRIFETYLYNHFWSETEIRGRLFEGRTEPQSIFISPDGTLDMPLILKRFAETFNEIYGDRGERFLEDEGRRYFMLYVKPIINGTGNYYIEAETRDALRTDMIIDYLGRRYVIEMKIWRGNAYNERGEKQLSEYLERYNLETGYMVSFCFNKNKVLGLRDPVTLAGRTLVEVVV